MKYTVTTPPSGRPVDYATAKNHLRLDSNEEQTVVELAIDAATDFAQDAMGTSLLAQTIMATFYVGEDIALPRGPLIAITSVTDGNGRIITDYDVWRVGHSDRLTINEAHEHPITVAYTAGYPNVAAIPASIRQAILVHVGTLYAMRESVMDGSPKPVPHSLADFYKLKGRNTGAA